MTQDPDTPSITLSSGTVIATDLVIAADGVHSVAVEAVLGKPNPPQPANHANCSYRFLIPRAELDADPETSFFVHGPQALGARIFAHPEGQRRIVSYPCREYGLPLFGSRSRLCLMNTTDDKEQL